MNLEIRFLAETDRKTMEIKCEGNQEARQKSVILEDLSTSKTSSISCINIFVPIFVFRFGLVITKM